MFIRLKIPLTKMRRNVIFTVNWSVGGGCCDSAEKDAAQFVHATNCRSRWRSDACRCVNAVHLVSCTGNLKPIISAICVHQRSCRCSKSCCGDVCVCSRYGELWLSIGRSSRTGNVTNAAKTLYRYKFAVKLYLKNVSTANMGDAYLI